MKTIIIGSKNQTNLDLLKQAINESEFGITEVVLGYEKAADQLGKQWAENNNIPIKLFKIDWNNIKVKGAKVKENSWGKKYNSNAGFDRNKTMVEYAECAIVVDEGTLETKDILKQINESKLKVFILKQKSEKKYYYEF